MNLYQYSQSFYRIQLCILSILAIAFLWVSRDQSMDLYLSDMWFDPISKTFPLRDNYWLELINHQLLKYMVIAISAGLLIYGAYQKNAELIITAILIGLGSATVGFLKSWSTHSCPWDIVRYGGQAIEYPLLSATSAFQDQVIASLADTPPVDLVSLHYSFFSFTVLRNEPLFLHSRQLS